MLENELPEHLQPIKVGLWNTWTYEQIQEIRELFRRDLDRVYIGRLSRIINRRPNTIHKWEYDNVLPERLIPARDRYGRRYWSREQVEEMKRWMIERAKRKWGFTDLPTEKIIDRVLKSLRTPRDHLSKRFIEEGEYFDLDL